MHEAAVQIQQQPVRSVEECQQQHYENQAGPAEAQPEKKQRRPHDVELLLHCERPRVAEHADRLPRDRHPVDHVEDHAQYHDPIVHSFLCRLWHHAGNCQDGDREKHGRQRREQSQRPPYVERAQVDPSRLRLLGQQKRRDEVAGQDEEEGDTGPAAAVREPGNAGVGAQYDQDRNPAQAIQLRTVLHRRDSRGTGLIRGG